VSNKLSKTLPLPSKAISSNSLHAPTSRTTTTRSQTPPTSSLSSQRAKMRQPIKPIKGGQSKTMNLTSQNSKFLSQPQINNKNHVPRSLTPIRNTAVVDNKKVEMKTNTSNPISEAKKVNTPPDSSFNFTNGIIKSIEPVHSLNSSHSSTTESSLTNSIKIESNHSPPDHHRSGSVTSNHSTSQNGPIKLRGGGKKK